ncbi:hypothetical protein PGPR2_00035 [Pseudomonas aeruginosa PGPR2]|nr:hypothetical protein PGPR2_00035 [Pseudomonas aeruginosa PGPR2]
MPAFQEEAVYFVEKKNSILIPGLLKSMGKILLGHAEIGRNKIGNSLNQ